MKKSLSAASSKDEARLPEPYFKKWGVRLYHGDAVDVMNALPAEEFDLIFADPPYGLSNGGMSFYAGKRVLVDKGEWDKSRGVEGNFEFHSDWIAACRRVLKTEWLFVGVGYLSFYLCLWFCFAKEWLACAQ